MSFFDTIYSHIVKKGKSRHKIQWNFNELNQMFNNPNLGIYQNINKKVLVIYHNIQGFSVKMKQGNLSAFLMFI